VLARGARGIPRVINQATHQALVLTCEIGSRTVDAESALEALAHLGLDGECGEPELVHSLVPPGRKPA